MTNIFHMAEDQWERILTALAGRYRRQMLVALLEYNPETDDDIDPYNTVTDSETDAETIKREMVHNHLPKLEALEYIEWDRDSDSIRRGRKWDEIAPLVTLLEDNRDELPDGWV